MWADVRSERQGLLGWAGWLRSGRVRRCYGSSDMGLAVSVGWASGGLVGGQCRGGFARGNRAIRVKIAQ